MSRQMQNFRRGNPQQQGRESNPEEEWRNEIKSSLGEDYVQKVLRFGELSLEEFRNFNDRIKGFIEKRSGRKGIGTTKMRKIYEIIKSAKEKRELIASLPLLAYMVGKETEKNKKNCVGEVITLLSDCIYKMESDEHFINIQKFTEALVAYNKYFSSDSE